MTKVFFDKFVFFFSFWSLYDPSWARAEREVREERNKNSEERSGRGRTTEFGSISKQQLRTPCRIFFDMPEKE